MFIIADQDSTITALIDSVSTATKAAAASGQSLGESLIEREANVLEHCRANRCLYLLRSGGLVLSVLGKGLIRYEEGDIVGLEAFLDDAANFTLSGDFAVEVEGFHCSLEALSPALKQYARLFVIAFAQSLKIESDEQPDLRSFSPGDIIVKEGEHGDEIYNLVDGGADVLLNGVKIGEVHQDEIFGALAALGRVPRTATVVAREPTMVLIVKRERIVDLIKQKPATIEKLIFDLAKVVQELNAKVVSA